MQHVIRTAYNYSRVALIMLMIAVLFTLNLGFLFQVPEASADNPAKLKDTMTDTDIGVNSNHTIQWVSVGTTTASSTITIDFPDAFRSTSSPAFANTDALDYDISTSSAIATNELTIFAAGQCPGDGDDNGGITAYEITSISTDNVFTFTHCADTPLIDVGVTTTVEIGQNATTGGSGDSMLVNPPTDAAGTQVITVTQGTENGTDTGDTRVFILDDVLLTAAVDTIFTFTITGVGQSEAKCGETTDEASSATTLPFGTMTAGAGNAKVLAQDLEVITNARNGHVVTIQQNQNPLSTTGADIDVLDDGTAQTTPAPWSSPAGTLDQEETFGHYGFTTEDDLNGDEFSDGANWAGFDGTNPDEIFTHDGPVNGATTGADSGTTSVCYQMEISALQEAANDYTNEITYIATPTF